MIRLEASHRRHALDDVHAVHRFAGFVAMALGVRGCQRQKSRMRDAAQEIRVERENDVGVFQLVLRVGVAAESRLGGGHRGVAIDRLPLDQFRGWVFGLDLLPLRSQRWRSDGLAEEIDSLSSAALLHRRRECFLEVRPLAGLPAQAYLLGAVRIVEIEQGGLGKRVRLALGHGVVGVAIYLDGAECVRLHQHRNCARRKGECRGEVHRLAEDEVLGLLDVGEDRLVGLLGASSKPGQRQRRTHHLEEPAAADRIHPFAGLAGKFALQHLVEGGRLGQLVQVLPEALAAGAVELGAHLGQSKVRTRRGRYRRNGRH